MVRSKTFFLTLAWFGLMIPQVKAAEPEHRLAGHYHCDGKYPDGKPFTYQIEIIKQEETYLIRVTSLENKEYLTEGVGILRGDVLAVGYHGAAGDGVELLLVGKGEKGPKLVGHWAQYKNPPEGRVGTETWHYERK
jgi:hypothetical protein